MAHHQIILVGSRLEAELLLVKEFRPDVVHLLYTKAVALQYKSLLDAFPRKVKVCEYEIDPYAIESISLLCVSIRDTLQEGDSLSYNITEGTKPSALACMAVARQRGDKVYYLSQEGELLDIGAHTRDFLNKGLTNEEFVTLYGNILNSYNLASQITPEQVQTAFSIKAFMEAHQKAFQHIQKQYRSQFGGRVEKLPPSFQVEREHNMFLSSKGGAMTITDRGKVIFHSPHPDTLFQFFTGRWWEVIVSHYVYQWDLNRRSDSQVWRNVEFSSPGTTRTKNELDILVNDRNRLILIECKSGYLGQENIYKIDGTRQTYGGRNSKGLLVTYYPLDESLRQKCEDLHIYNYSPPTEKDRPHFIEHIGAWLDSVVKELEQ